MEIQILSLPREGPESLPSGCLFFRFFFFYVGLVVVCWRLLGRNKRKCETFLFFSFLFLAFHCLSRLLRAHGCRLGRWVSLIVSLILSAVITVAAFFLASPSGEPVAILTDLEVEIQQCRFRHVVEAPTLWPLYAYWNTKQTHEGQVFAIYRSLGMFPDGGDIYPLCSRFYGEFWETSLLKYFFDVIDVVTRDVSIDNLYCNNM